MTPEKNKIWLTSLSLGCPFETPCEGCPLEPLRALHEERRMRAIDSTAPHLVEEHLLYHRNCMMSREGGVRP